MPYISKENIEWLIEGIESTANNGCGCCPNTQEEFDKEIAMLEWLNKLKEKK